MNSEPDFTDQLQLYTAKMRMESDPMWKVGVQAYQQQLKADAVRIAIADLEEARWRFSQVLTPFLPEPSESQPVALQSDPAPQFNGHQTGFDHEAEFFGNDPYQTGQVNPQWRDILGRAG